MKKTYFAPEATIVKIATVGMLAGSETMGLNGGSTGDKGKPSNSLGRSFDFTEDE